MIGADGYGADDTRAAEEKKVTTGQGEEIHLETELRPRATGRPNVSKQG